MVQVSLEIDILLEIQVFLKHNVLDIEVQITDDIERIKDLEMKKNIVDNLKL